MTDTACRMTTTVAPMTHVLWPMSTMMRRMSGTVGRMTHVLGPMNAAAPRMSAFLHWMTTTAGRMTGTARRMTAVDKARNTVDGVSTAILALSTVGHWPRSAASAFTIVEVGLCSGQVGLPIADVAPWTAEDGFWIAEVAL
jgi:hypothetical protein